MERINIYLIGFINLISLKRKLHKLISVKISAISVEKTGGFNDNLKTG